MTMYHEYTNGTRRHYNGMRLGAQRLDPFELAEEQNPDSHTWENRAQVAKAQLDGLLDDPTWDAWCDYFNAKCEGMTWRDIRNAYRKAAAAVHEAIRGQYPITAEAIAFAAGLIDQPDGYPFDAESDAEYQRRARLANAVITAAEFEQ
jgi:hypothetical protein